MLRQQAGHRHQEPGRAEAALQGVALVKCLLDGMQRSTRRSHALYSRYFVAFGLDRKHQARPDRRSVEEDSAAPANAVLAADVGAGKAEIVAQVVRQQPARIGRRGVDDAVDPQAAKAFWVRARTR